MRRPWFALLGLLSFSCGANPPFMSRRLDDGTMQLTCQKTLPECLAHFEDICGGDPYEVVGAHDLRRPVDIVVGTHQRQARTSEARIRCGHGNAMPPAPAAAAASSPQAARACVPGATQACIGAGACAGGQSCLADGSGFGACDCGRAQHPVDGGGQ